MTVLSQVLKMNITIYNTLWFILLNVGLQIFIGKHEFSV